MSFGDKEREPSVSRTISFASFVDFDTRVSAGFAPYGKPSTTIPTSSGGWTEIYLGHVSNGDEFNIVVMAERIKRSDGIHTNWYIRTFSGKSPSELETGEEIQEFDKKVETTLKRRNRITGEFLPLRIEQIVEETTTHVLSAPLPH
jgi:hypothetical protein